MMLWMVIVVEVVVAVLGIMGSDRGCQYNYSVPLKDFPNVDIDREVRIFRRVKIDGCQYNYSAPLKYFPSMDIDREV